MVETVVIEKELMENLVIEKIMLENMTLVTLLRLLEIIDNQISNYSLAKFFQ